VVSSMRENGGVSQMGEIREGRGSLTPPEMRREPASRYKRGGEHQSSSRLGVTGDLRQTYFL
jgi:hypothetical protein